MEATKILKTLYEVRKQVQSPAKKELEKLILDLEMEARNKTQTVDGRKQLSAIRKFAKQCVKEMENTHENLAGAFKSTYEGGERWCLCDGFTGIVLNDIAGLPVAKVPNETFKMDKIISPAKYTGIPFTLPAYTEIKSAYDLAKAAHDGKATTFNHTTDLENGATVATTKLLLFMEMLGIDGGEARQDGIHNPIFAAGNEIEGVLLPIRKKGKKD